MSDEKRPKLHIEGDWKSEAQADKERLSRQEEAPKIHVDQDWKAQAQAEKERLARESEQKSRERGPRGAHDLPEASFKTLMSVLASQAIMGLGTMTDPKSGGVVVDLEGSKFSIDLLGVLEEKTKGNLDEEEKKELQQVLHELRSRFVQVAQLVAEQVRADQAGGGSRAQGTPGRAGPSGPGSPGPGSPGLTF